MLELILTVLFWIVMLVWMYNESRANEGYYRKCDRYDEPY